MKSILWILNGCGLEGRGITGGPVRFHEVSKRFAADGFVQHLLTTPGGKAMQTTLGCELPMTVVPASLLLRSEPCRPFRFWSYPSPPSCGASAHRNCRGRMPLSR